MAPHPLPDRPAIRRPLVAVGALLAGAVLAVSTGSPASAATCTWTNTASGSWHVATNWSCGGDQRVPTIADDVVIDIDPAGMWLEVGIEEDAEAGSLTIGKMDTTRSSKQRVVMSSELDPSPRQLTIGDGGVLVHRSGYLKTGRSAIIGVMGRSGWIGRIGGPAGTPTSMTVYGDVDAENMELDGSLVIDRPPGTVDDVPGRMLTWGRSWATGRVDVGPGGYLYVRLEGGQASGSVSDPRFASLGDDIVVADGGRLDFFANVGGFSGQIGLATPNGVVNNAGVIRSWGQFTSDSLRRQVTTIRGPVVNTGLITTPIQGLRLDGPPGTEHINSGDIVVGDRSFSGFDEVGGPFEIAPGSTLVNTGEIEIDRTRTAAGMIDNVGGRVIDETFVTGTGPVTLGFAGPSEVVVDVTSVGTIDEVVAIWYGASHPQIGSAAIVPGDYWEIGAAGAGEFAVGFPRPAGYENLAACRRDGTTWNCLPSVVTAAKVTSPSVATLAEFNTWAIGGTAIPDDPDPRPDPDPDPQPDPQPEPDFVPVEPDRVLDTRPGDKVPAGGTVEIDIGSQPGIPADASAVAVIVTVTDPDAPGFITAHPCDTTRPNASNLNYVAGQTIANAVIVKIGDNGRICLYTDQSTHLIADISGAFVLDSDFDALDPGRLLDTRPGGQTIDGLFAGDGKNPAGQTIELQVTGRAGAPTSAGAAVLNLTVNEPEGAGFVTAYPCGTTRPNASNLNYMTDQTIPNNVIVKIGDGGKVCLYTDQTTHLIADLAGTFPTGSDYLALDPARLLDTRAPGGQTIDGQFAENGKNPAGDTIELQITGRGGAPTTAGAAVLNLTVNEPEGAGFVTAYPCGTTRPNASNLNYIAGQTIPNNVIVKIGDNGKICIYTDQTTHLIADLNGTFPE